MSNLKKIVCLALVMILCIPSFEILANAVVYDEVDEELIVALQSAEPVKTDLGLANVDFENLKILSPISVYSYMQEGFVESFWYHPLMENNELVAIAIEMRSETRKLYQITVELVDEIKDLVESRIDFALVYDYDACYAYDGSKFIKVKHNTSVNSDRKSLDSRTKESIEGLQLSNMGVLTPVRYQDAFALTRSTAPMYYTCPVPIVPQVYSNICWAACTASIRNYKQGTNLTAEQVARNYLGNDFNYTLLGSEIQTVLQQNGLFYTYKNYAANDNTILCNLQNGDPIIGGFNDHVCVIYLYHVLSGYIYVMNPQGLTRADGSVVYTYQVTYNADHGTYTYLVDGTMRKYRSAFCKTWTH